MKSSRFVAPLVLFSTSLATASSLSYESTSNASNFVVSSNSFDQDDDHHVNAFILSSDETETDFQARTSSFAAWLDKHIWNHSLAADTVAFRLPLLGSNKDDKNKERSLQIEEEQSIIPNPGEDLVVTVTFRDIYKTIFFIAIAWFLGTLSVSLGLPSLVGEIFAGFLLGPPLADFVPYPGALVLAGNIGLIGLILESGIGLDVAQLKEVGSRALIMGIVGSSLPLVVGFGVGQWIGKDIKPSIAVGAAFAPSSLGVASAALSTSSALNTPIGNLIVASSVFDDVFGLILLSIIEVFADPNPKAFDYILPFLSSFGYLIVLGYIGITKLPKIIEKHILPLVSEGKRDQFAMILMMLVMTAYMLALNYSGASYLTGVFLAGLTFSQIHSVHASFVTHGRPLLEWLLRIFFSATIGFQVPVTKFGDPYVVKWGFALLLPVFAKLPLGLLVPHFTNNIPDDFPYNPYYRDVIVTSLSMTCRGEFNFIVASYALSQGLFRPEVYSAVIFAVLFGSIACPLLLSKVLRYYNDKSLQFLGGNHPIQRIGNTCDGYRPLFLAIQARTPVHWSLQEAFAQKLSEMGLLVIDHRHWHTLGTSREAVDITELFVQDTKVKVKLKGCFSVSLQLTKDETIFRKSIDSDEAWSAALDSIPTIETPMSTSSSLEEGLDEEEEIRLRCAAIKEALTKCLGTDTPQDYAIQVSQWEAFVVEKSESFESSDETETSTNPRPKLRLFYSFHSMNEDDDKNQESSEAPKATSEVKSSSKGNQHENLSHRQSPSLQQLGSSLLRRVDSSDIDYVHEEPLLSTPDLWELDNACHDATRTGYTRSPDLAICGMHTVQCGFDGHQSPPPFPARSSHTRAVSFDAALLTPRTANERDIEISIIRDRLHGYVRHHQLGSHP